MFELHTGSCYFAKQHRSIIVMRYKCLLELTNGFYFNNKMPIKVSLHYEIRRECQNMLTKVRPAFVREIKNHTFFERSLSNHECKMSKEKKIKVHIGKEINEKNRSLLNDKLWTFVPI
jgi:hypothetical protein